MTISRMRNLGSFVRLCALACAVVAQPAVAHAQEALGAPFTLTDPAGKSISSSDFKGKWMLIYFGYSHCADLCPTELAEMIDALRQIGAEAKFVQPIFITIDPERDNGKYLAAYVAQFDDRLIGLGGTPQQVADVATASGQCDQAGTCTGEPVRINQGMVAERRLRGFAVAASRHPVVFMDRHYLRSPELLSCRAFRVRESRVVVLESSWRACRRAAPRRVRFPVESQRGRLPRRRPPRRWPATARPALPVALRVA